MRYSVKKKQPNSKLKDGTVAVEGRGKYLKMQLSKIGEFDAEEQEWKVVPSPHDPDDVEI